MARVKSSEFDRVLDLIRAVYRLGPAKGCNGTCGHDFESIYQSVQNLTSPLDPTIQTLARDDLRNLLERAVRDGIFRRNNVHASCPAVHGPDAGFCYGQHVDSDVAVESLYHVNQQMVSVNWSNKKYADYFNRSIARTPGDLYDPYYSGVGEGGIGTTGICPGAGTG